MTTAVKKVPSDIAIAQAAKLRPIRDVAAELGLSDDDVELYGRHKAKISLRALESRAAKGRLVLVTTVDEREGAPALNGAEVVIAG